MHILIAEDDTALADRSHARVAALRLRGATCVDERRAGRRRTAAQPLRSADSRSRTARLDGLEVLKRRCARDKLRLPILILTARDSVDERVRGLDLGADDFLAKPFSLSELEARVRALDAAWRGGTHADGVLGDLRFDRVSRTRVDRRSAASTSRRASLRCSRSSSAGPAGSSARSSSSTDCANGATRSRPTPSRSTSTGCARSSKARGS